METGHTDYSYNLNGAMTSRTAVTGSNTISETFAYDGIQNLLKKYVRTQGVSADDWRYRYTATGEREQKRLYSTTQRPAREWTYYLLDGRHRQLAVYEGVEAAITSCGPNIGTPPVYLAATEYNSFGQGSIHNLTTRPTASTTSRKEYKVQDYLGTTRLVIEPDGMGGGVITGRFDHAPYGELLWSNAPEKRLSWVDKEKDEESGDHNFGVRQYDDGLGRFPTIDPFWEKYPSLSPYHYGANNPLLYIDPSGQTIIISYDEQVEGNRYENCELTYKKGKVYTKDGKEYKGNNKFVKEVVGYLNQLKATGHIEITKRLSQLETSEQTHVIHSQSGFNNYVRAAQPQDEEQAKANQPTGSSITLNLSYLESANEDPRVVLGHELLGHSYHYDTGTTKWGYYKSGVEKREAQAVNIENVVRAIFGYDKKTEYEGKKIPSSVLWDTHGRSKK